MKKEALCVCSVFFVFCCAGMNDIQVSFSKEQEENFLRLLDYYGVNGLFESIHYLKKGKLVNNTASQLRRAIGFVQSDDCQQTQEIDSDAFDLLCSMASSAVGQFVELYREKKTDRKFNKSHSELIKQIDALIGEID